MHGPWGIGSWWLNHLPFPLLPTIASIQKLHDSFVRPITPLPRIGVLLIEVFGHGTLFIVFAWIQRSKSIVKIRHSPGLPDAPLHRYVASTSDCPPRERLRDLRLPL